MTSDQISVAAALGLLGTGLGWIARGMSLATRWGELKQEMKGVGQLVQVKIEAVQTELSTVRADIAVLSSDFKNHLAQDAIQQRHLDDKLTDLTASVNQLIGAQRKEG